MRLKLKGKSCFPEGEFGAQAFDGEADDIAEGAGDAFDDFIAAFLNGIRAGLVEGINLRQVITDLTDVEGTEDDVGGVGEKLLAMAAEMDEADAGDDAMGASLQLLEHAAGIVKVGGLAEEGGIQGDQGVGA